MNRLACFFGPGNSVTRPQPETMHDNSPGDLSVGVRKEFGVCGGVSCNPKAANWRVNIGALIFRIGFWGPLNHRYKKEPPK